MRKEIKDVIAWLRLIRTPMTISALGGPSMSQGEGSGKSLDRVESLASRRGFSMYRVASHAEDYPELGRLPNLLLQVR